MRVIIEKNYDLLSRWAANYVAKRINEYAPKESNPFVLGLPTGSSPLGMYKHLIELNRQGKVSFRNVVTFNMDEWNNFFSHIDIPSENVHILNGNAADLTAECARYEATIRQFGGIHLFIGGIGPDGHIAFNEPGSSLSSRTRIKELTQDTIIANSRFFGGDVSQVPHTALTVGVGTVMDAQEVMVLVNGHQKARALLHVIERPISHMWTVSALQMHQHGIIVCDESACDELKVGTYKYFLDIEKNNLDPDTLFN